MRVMQVNIFGNLSTGRIAVDIHKEIVGAGHEGLVAFARNHIECGIPYYKIGNKYDVLLHGVLTRITDRTGLYSKRATKKLIKKIEQYKPDIVHLHNIHGYYLNYYELFTYLKKSNVGVVWTLHDCWAYTGHCCYFEMAACNKWLEHCEKCPQKKAYPASFLLDASYDNFELKKSLFTDLNIRYVTVSKWLETVTKKSFLSNESIQTIYNGIDLSVFKPVRGKFREKYNLVDKKIILGVASTWDIRKGFDDFLKLASRLNEDTVVVLVGVGDKEIKRLLPNMLGIRRTDSIEELVQIYSDADFFLNASVEETFGLPTLESLACGTPVIVYNATALPEVVTSECGYIVEPHDIGGILSIISKEHPHLTVEKCRIQAQKFEKHLNYQEYIKLYQEIIGEKS